MILNSIRHGALTICLAGLGWLAFVGAAISQVVIQDGFESGSFSAAWSLTAGVEVPATGGAMESTRFARLASYSSTTGRELGARFDGIAPDGARNFSLDFFFRVQNSANRQFHLHVSTSAGAIGSSAPALSLRYQGGWAAYDGAAWQSLTSLGTVQTNSWFRARVDGQDWGTPRARWSVQVLDLGGMTFTRSVTNLTYYQGGTPGSNPARYFVLTSVFGNNPGFDVDEVDAQVLATPPAVSNAVVNISGI